MQIPKPTEADRERFHSLVPKAPEVEVQPMFGSLGAFANGNMFMGLFGSDIGLKLGNADRAQLAALGAGPFGPSERPMGGYLALPSEWDAAKATPWIERAHAAAVVLPPKAKKATNAKKATTKKAATR